MATNPSRKRLTRRQFLPGAMGVLAAGAAGATGYELRGQPPAADPTPAAAKSPSPAQSQIASTQPTAGYHSFVTRPDLRPPIMEPSDLVSAATTESSPRFIALTCGAVDHDPRIQSGPLLVDRQGRTVWFRPMPVMSYDMQVQSYQGKPVITWWTGSPVSWHGVGTATILGSSYRTVQDIKGFGKYRADLHDFVLTSRGTALLTTYFEARADLSSQGGPRNGRVWAGRVLEIDVASGDLVFEWNSLDHVPISESQEPFAKHSSDAYRYFHLNSIGELPDGNLLISARNTWTVYAVDRGSGKILWRLGGKRSDFEIPHNARFSWQHHVRARGSSIITLFDNGMDTSRYSRGLMLSYDTGTKQVKLISEFLHPARFSCGTLGSVQLLPDGRVFVGWGVQPYYSEYDGDGTMISDTEFPIGNRSYRAYLVDWVGHPTDKPAVAAKANPGGGFVVYASWNGATEIATWTVLAGKDKTSLQPIGSQPWSGFETAIVVNSKGPAFAVVAQDSEGNELGRSEIV